MLLYSELPPFIIQLIKRKRKMFREYQNSRNVAPKTEINKFYTNIQSLIQQYKQYTSITTCKEINRKQGRNYWQEIKK